MINNFTFLSEKQLDILIEANACSSKNIILIGDDYRLIKKIYDYDNLYVYKNLLCGSYTFIINNGILSVTTFEIPIFEDKKVSKDLIRFVSRTLDFNYLLKSIKYLNVKNKPLINILLKSKKISKSFKNFYRNSQILQ